MSPKILSVDDSKAVRKLLARMFRPFDCELCEAANGEEGLAVAAREIPDLIILDWKMPKMSGIDVLKQLRHDGCKTPIIFLTGLSDASYEEAALIGGAVDFIEKSRGFAILLKRAELSLKHALSPEKRFGTTTDPAAAGIVKIEHLALSPDANVAFWKGKKVCLTVNECKMVRLMAEREIGRAHV